MPAEGDRIECYARALVALGQCAGNLQSLEQDLLEIVEEFETNNRLQGFLGDIRVAATGKAAALTEVLEGKVDDVLRHFILMLHSQGDLNLLKPIAASFYDKASELCEKVSGVLVSARPLSSEKIAHVEKHVGALLGKEVSLLAKEDRSLLGGIRVQVGDTLIDGTIDRELEDIYRQLAR